MGWLYAQTWLWYLLSFAVGVLLAWLLFVLPRRGDRDADRSTADDATRAVPVAAPAAAERADDPPERAEPVTEQLPAVDPALSTLDTSTGRSGVGAAGLAAGALGAAGARRGDDGARRADDGAGSADTTGEIPRVDPEATTRIPVVRPDDAAQRVDRSGAPGSGEETTRIPVVAPETATDPGLRPADGTATAVVPTTGPDTPGPDTPGQDDVPVAGGSPEPPAVDAGPAEPVDAAPADVSPAEEPVVGEPPAGEPVVDAAPDDLRPAADHGDAPASDRPADEPATGTPVGSTAGPAPDEPGPGVGTAAAGAGVGAAAAGLAVAANRPADHSAENSAGNGAGAVQPGRFPGSALPLDGGAPPTPEHTVKGNAQSMLYHSTASPYYSRTRAEVWFRNAEDAEAAGFTDIRRRRR